MIFFRFHKIVCLISTILFSFTISLEAPAQQPQSLGEYETPPNLHAKEVLSPDLLSGNHFWVDDLVRSNGYLNIYGLNTDYGYLLANGTYQLKEREQEIAALSELEKFSNSKVFLDASKKAGINLIMAPVNMAKTVVNAVADPAETLEKVQKIPAGILGLFGDITDTVQSGFDSISGAVSNSDSNKESDLESKAKDFAIEKGLDHIGYNKKEAEWYKKLGVDLYTSNPILRDKISTIVKIETAVNIGFDFVPGIGTFGMLGKASKYIKYT
ncbi:MAG: hypothetical protein GYA55_03175, partial [SAR324 cluster bacterium]|nr:hypothetical protein [SAR324 cluster bacterium]